MRTHAQQMVFTKEELELITKSCEGSACGLEPGKELAKAVFFDNGWSALLSCVGIEDEYGMRAEITMSLINPNKEVSDMIVTTDADIIMEWDLNPNAFATDCEDYCSGERYVIDVVTEYEAEHVHENTSQTKAAEIEYEY